MSTRQLFAGAVGDSVFLRFFEKFLGQEQILHRNREIVVPQTTLSSAGEPRSEMNPQRLISEIVLLF